MAARISIIIPSWNGKALLAACLESLRGQTWRDFEVLVVDDGSTDGTGEFVAQADPAVRVTRLPHNSGFCIATNTGIRESEGELVFLLNNDMTLAPDCLERLVGTLDVSAAAMAGPLVLWRDEPETVYSAGDLIRVNGRPENIGYRAPLTGFALPARVFGVSAGAALVRRSLLDEIGLLDERFGSYFEDADLCFRARLAGFEIALVPEARAYHVGSASLLGTSWKRARQCFRNHALLVIKNMPAPLLLRHGPAIARERLHQAARVVSSARCELGLLRALRVLASTALSLAHALPHALRERRRIQRVRRISPAQVEALLSPRPRT